MYCLMHSTVQVSKSVPILFPPAIVKGCFLFSDMDAQWTYRVCKCNEQLIDNIKQLVASSGRHTCVRQPLGSQLPSRWQHLHRGLEQVLVNSEACIQFLNMKGTAASCTAGSSLQKVPTTRFACSTSSLRSSVDAGRCYTQSW